MLQRKLYTLQALDLSLFEKTPTLVLQKHMQIFHPKKRQLQTSDVTALQSTPAIELHLLRHFSTVSEEYINRLLNKSITHQHITDALSTGGSKFFQDISGIQDPAELFDLIKTHLITTAEKSTLSLFDYGDTLRAFFSIQYHVPVGLDTLIPMDRLSAEQQQTIITKQRGDLAGDNATMIKIIHGITPEPTNTISIQLGLPMNPVQELFLTAYPGIQAPDFPNDQQSADERQHSTQFWNTHVFIQ
jgi:hypothetical protein